MKLIKCLIFCLSVVMPSLAFAERCTWIEDRETIDYFSPLPSLEGGLQDWDVNCKAEDPSHEYMKKCWCDINRARLIELKKRITEIENKYPALVGKKVCYKEDEFTSINISFSSSKKFFERCDI